MGCVIEEVEETITGHENWIIQQHLEEDSIDTDSSSDYGLTEMYRAI